MTINKVVGMAASGRTLRSVNSENMHGMWKELNVLNSLIKF